LKNINNLPDFFYERKFHRENIIVAGIDEAGRGAIAGPVVAAAVILPQKGIQDIGINDSKKLTPGKREQFYNIFKELKISVGIGIIDNIRIDKINILQSTFEAMRIAVEGLKQKPGHLLIDGNRFKDIGIPFTTIIGGDSKSLSIAAASIIAKVTRDRWMIEKADKLYPKYGFTKHKGYGTKKHIEAVENNGLCPLHRKTFLRKYSSDELTLFDSQ